MQRIAQLVVCVCAVGFLSSSVRAEEAPPVDGITGASYTIPQVPRPNPLIKKTLEDWLQTHWFMSLATCDEKGRPSVGGVTFYVENMVVYFKTQVDSTKAVNIARNPNVSYTVWDKVENMQDLKALQVVGKARILEGQERDRIAAILDGAKGSTQSNLETFFQKQGIERSYTGKPFEVGKHVVIAITPEWARFNDNSIAMGHSDVYRFDK